MGADNPLGHEGEVRMRRVLPGQHEWSEGQLRQMMRPTLTPGLAAFIEAQPFFFIATADAEGHCDASFRGREHNAGGAPLPAIKVLDERRLMFPDFPGNGLYNSLGNITVNPHIGLLFMDFARQRRARVNGLAAIEPATAEITAIWPLAQAAVVVTVEQAFGNCPARIPRMIMAPDSDMGMG